jgi:photosystem II stability/assembly factor-like uncharacterized protein
VPAPPVPRPDDRAVELNFERTLPRIERSITGEDQQADVLSGAIGGIQTTAASESSRVVAGAAARAPLPASAPQAPSADALTPPEAQLRLSLREAVGLVIASPDPKVLWRIGRGAPPQYSFTGGQQWESLVVDGNPELTAGVSPSPSVCWLVGRAGTILRTTDGRGFQRIPFPEAVDLAGVASTSDLAATVTAADGRVFRTTDGGVTWK